MRHTLKAVFNDHDIAQHALDTLLASGYLSDDAVLTTVLGNRRSNGTGTHAIPRRKEQNGTSTTRLMDFLFSHDKNDFVPSTVSRCPPDSHILTLATDSEPEAQRATLLISGFVRTDGEDGAASVPDNRSSILPIRYRFLAAPGTLHSYVGGASQRLSKRNAEKPSRTRSTVLEPMAPATQWPGSPRIGSDELDKSVGLPVGDDKSRAASRFGHDIHNNDRYRNRSWSEAVADLKVLWEKRNPGRGKWESSESAIRAGWNSTSPEIDDDSYYREHWKTRYSRSPVDRNVRTGRVKATSQSDEESKAAWKKRHPGELPAWESFIDALRHGWGRITIGLDMDESDYRVHHAQHYPDTDYNDLAPVYRYGNNVRGRAAFRDRSWDEAESELRAEWERGYREGKPSTWDEMKAALYRGWTHAES